MSFSCSESHFPCSTVPFAPPSEFPFPSLDLLSAPSGSSGVPSLTCSRSFSADLTEICEQVPAYLAYCSALPLTSRPPGGGRRFLTEDRAPILAATPPQECPSMPEQLSIPLSLPCEALFSSELEEGRASHPFPVLIWVKPPAFWVLPPAPAWPVSYYGLISPMPSWLPRLSVHRNFVLTLPI